MSESIAPLPFELTPQVREALRTEIKSILLDLMRTDHEKVAAFIRNVIRDQIDLERQYFRQTMRR